MHPQQSTVGFALWLLLAACGSVDESTAHDDASDNTANQSWIRGLESGKLVVVTGGDADSLGNFYVTGTFTGKFPLGEADAIGSEEPNIFVASYSPGGERRWVRTFPSERGAIGGDIAVDEAGQIFVTGSFAGQTSLADGELLESAGEGDILLASLDQDGTARWTKLFGGLGAEVPQAITAQRGRVCVAGYMRGSFEIGSMRAQGLTQLDGFAACWRASDGAAFWLRGFAGDENDVATAITLNDEGEAWVALSFENQLSAFGQQLQTVGDFDTALLRVSPSGNLEWFAQLGSEGSDNIGALAAGEAGVLFAGTFAGPLAGDTQYASGQSGTFVAQLDARGTPSWASVLENAGAITDLAFDGRQILVTGGMNGEWEAAGHTLVSEGNSDVFYAALDTEGELQRAQSFGSLEHDLSLAVAGDGRGGVFVTGQHGQAITLGDETVSSLGLNGAFVAKIANPGSAL